MAILSPDVVFKALARMLGQTPESLGAIVTSVQQRFAALDAEISGAKAGAAGMVRHFDARFDSVQIEQNTVRVMLRDEAVTLHDRLNSLEQQLARIESMLLSIDAVPPGVIRAVPYNGRKTNVADHNPDAGAEPRADA